MFTTAHVIRLSNLSPAQQRRVLLSLPLSQRVELARIARSMLASRGVSGLGKSFFSKVGDFFKGAAKTVGNLIIPKVPEPQVIVQQVPESKQAEKQTPEWVGPVAIGAGVLLLVVLLRKGGR